MMEQINLIVEWDDVMQEVDKATDYPGATMDDSSEVRDRIAMTGADMENLRRFWEESASSANDRLKDMFVSGTIPGSKDNYDVILEVSKSFNKALVPSVQSSLRSYFVQSIVGKWFRFTNKKESEVYIAEANRLMEDVMRKLYSRQRPVSPRRSRS